LTNSTNGDRVLDLGRGIGGLALTCRRSRMGRPVDRYSHVSATMQDAAGKLDTAFRSAISGRRADPKGRLNIPENIAGQQNG